MKRLILAAVVLMCWARPAAGASFMAFGPFTIQQLPHGRYMITDALGRKILLVPRGQSLRPGSAAQTIVRIPIRRVAISGGRDTSILMVLGEMDKLVAVTGRPDGWVLEPVKRGLATGRIASVGQGHNLDYEQLAKLKPEVFFTWDEAAIPMLERLGITVVITYADTARDLETQLNIALLMGVFFGQKAIARAKAYITRVKAAAARLKAIVARATSRPRVIWGDIYEKRVLVEPGNSWAAQLVKLAGGEYLFDDIRGTS